MWGECGSCLGATRDVPGVPGTGAAIRSTKDVYFLAVFWTSVSISKDRVAKAYTAFIVFPLCHVVSFFLPTF